MEIVEFFQPKEVDNKGSSQYDEYEVKLLIRQEVQLLRWRRDMKFGEKLKRYRSKKGLTQEEVAKKLGISCRAYASYETKNVRPRRRETYEKLADILDCDMNDLLIEENAMPSPMAYAGMGLIGIGSVLMGPAGLVSAAALGPLAYYIQKHGGKDTTLDDWMKMQNRLALQYEKKQKQFSVTALGLILTELGKKDIKCRIGDVKDLTSKGSVPDDYILLDDQNIDEWWFVFWCEENRKNEQYVISDHDRTYILFNRFAPTVPDPRRKSSIILNDEKMFTEICKLKGRNSYRGNLTVILINTEDTKIIKEEQISFFDVDATEDRMG